MNTTNPSRSLARLGALLLVCAAFVALPRSAFAAGEINGRISGYVYDPTGSPLAMVPLTVSGSSLQGTQTRQTGDDGKYEFNTLPPGDDYVVEVNVPGFAPVRQKGIKVRVGQTTPVDIKLDVISETQPAATYEIVEKVNPVINPDSAQNVAIVTAEKAAQTPIFHQVEGIPQQAPGVGPGTRPSTRGGFARYSKFYVDGMDTSDPTNGFITSPMNFDAVEQFEVITGGLDAQYNALGMVENIVTKSGSNRFTYDANLTISPPAFIAQSRQSTNQPGFAGAFTNATTPLPNTSFWSPVLNVGGPIIKDRLWFYVSGQLNRSNADRTVQTVFTPYEVRRTHTDTDLARAKLTFQATPKDRISLAIHLDHNAISNNINSNSATIDAEQQINRHGMFLIGNYDHNFTDNILFQLQTGMTRKNENTDPQNDNDAINHFDSNSSTNAFQEGRISADVQGNFLHEAKNRLQFDPTLLVNLHNHQIKGGVQVAYLTDEQITGVTGNQRYTDRVNNGLFCDPTNPATFGSCFQRVDFYNLDGQPGPLDQKATALNFGIFLQDRWTVNRNLTIIPGIRYDIGKLWGDNKTPVATLKGIGPRLSATYDVLGDRKNLIVGHYGRSNDVGNVYIAQHANAALYQVQSTFSNNQFPTCTINSSAPGCTTSGGPQGRQFDKNPTAPHVDEVMLGFHREIAPETVLGLDGTWRRYSDNWVDEEVNRIWDPSGTRITGYQNGVAQSILLATTSDKAYRDYKGMDLWVQGNPGRWDLLASYTLSYTKGTVSDYFDGYLQNPRIAALYDGWVPDDRRHQLKGAISYRTTFGLDLGFRVQYRTGSPGWESFRNPADSNQSYYRSPRGTGYSVGANGTQNLNDPSGIIELRNPSIFILDAEARYDLGHLINIGENKAEITFYVVNLLGSTDITAYADASGTRYGLVSSRNSPAQGELIFRIRN